MTPKSDSRLASLSHLHAVRAFGAEATDAVLKDSTWCEKYPAMVDGIRSDDLRTENVTLLPAEVLIAIAGREDCLHDFQADPHGIGLYASFRGHPPALPFAVKDAVRLPRQEALARYGASCLFRAADLGVVTHEECAPERFRVRPKVQHNS